MATIFNGKQYAQQKEKSLKKRIDRLREQGIVPKLVWINANDDPASRLYGKLKAKAAERLGVGFEKLEFAVIPDIVKAIQTYNQDPKVHGIMVQLPIVGVQNFEPLQLINPAKDVDCLTPENLGRVVMGIPRFLPATVAAVTQILELRIKNYELDDSNPKLKTKRIMVIGGGLEVGKPLVNHLSNLGATVLWARSSEKNLKQITQIADIIISATGQPGLITGDMLPPSLGELRKGKSGVIAIDVGSPKGDFDFESVKKKASFITPVPGGVGPVTVVSLMSNVILATEMSIKS